ncbi:hypothetical protein [Kitasatospora purpeofusca]|uniref:hypothetical protein n=1 Tax=Kitasatospora purpeofusca TaxID=67352 RepID=UPI0037FC8622
MTRIINRLVLGAAGLTATAASTAVLLAAAGVRLPDRWPSWLPHHPDDAALPAAVRTRLSSTHAWSDPTFLVIAAAAVLALLLLVAQSTRRSPKRLRLASGELRTSALAAAVEQRARAVAGVTGAVVRIGRGRAPLVELTARLSEQAEPGSTAEALAEVLAEASRSTGLSFRERIHLTAAARPGGRRGRHGRTLR